MNAFTLLTTLNARGVRLSREGDRLVTDAPAGLLTADDRRIMAAHKADLFAVLDFDTDADLALLVLWFRQMRAANYLPLAPFILAPWVQVADPARFYAALERDIAAGPRGPRARLGGLADSLRRLRAFVDMQGEREQDGNGSERAPATDR
jgi:hypothetical protein